jgi:hypothetical protein
VSADATAPEVRRGRRRRGAAWATVVVVLVLVGLAGGPPTTQEPLDPRSTAPDGLHGLLALAEEMGGQVDIATDLPSDTSTRLLLARDDLSAAEREELEGWIEDGGVAVVADPGSPVHDLEPGAPSLADLVGERSRAPDCDVAALAEVAAVTHGSWSGFEVSEVDDAAACFGVDDEVAWLVLQPRGQGALVSLGSPAPLLNRSLDRGDNAVLAAALLFPDPGTSLRVLESGAAGEGAEVADLVPPRVVAGLALLLLAAVVAVLAIARRLGRPVEERLPPTVPTAELARSLGDLLQRAGRREAAAGRLRDEARTALGRQLGTGLPPEALVERAVARLDVPHEVAARALLDQPVPDDRELAAVAEAVAGLHDRLRAPS